MKYECGVCGYIYDESKTGSSWDMLDEGWRCPICDAVKVYFSPLEQVEEKEEEVIKTKQVETIETKRKDLSYLSGFERHDDAIEKHMDIIHEMAKTGESVIEPMRTKLDTISWDDILVVGAQLGKFVLEEHDEVKTKTKIGKKAKKPLVIESPVFITHMSFGALSKEFKISLARGSCDAKTAMCSGEGGILPESMDAAYRYIFEYVPNKYSVTDENLKNVDAIEIKVGQGAKPGMGGHLPGEKVTEEIARIRDKKISEDIISPSKFKEIKSKEDLKKLVEDLRKRSEGRPIGIKIAAGNIEEDLKVIVFTGADFVTIDGRAGGTGASPKLIKDATTVPTIFALSRARKYLDENNIDIELIITGGLRVSSDFIKALALGADAIAIGSAAMMAAACQQYRVCNTGKCPVGCATQDEDLRKRLNQDNSALRLANFLNVTLEELKTFARITGNDDVHKISANDLCTTDSEISNNTPIRHV